MSQNPIVLPTTGTVSGLQLVQDANAALDTLNTKWAGSSPPPSPEPYQDWLDTSTSPPTLRIYDGAEWVAVAQIDTVNHAFLPLGLVPTGTMAPFAGIMAPAGWLLCYGQAVSRVTYAGLFTIIGTTYGAGDGSSTFNVPDMRGRTVFGVDNMGGTVASRVTSSGSGIAGITLGATGGDELLQSHVHGITDPGHAHSLAVNSTNGGQITPQNNYLGNDNNGQYFTAANTFAASDAIRSNATGIGIQNAGAGAAQNMPPSIMLNYIVKA